MNDKHEMSLLPFFPSVCWSGSLCALRLPENALETLIYWRQYQCEEQMFDDVASYEAHGGLLHFSTFQEFIHKALQFLQGRIYALLYSRNMSDRSNLKTLIHSGTKQGCKQGHFLNTFVRRN